MTQETAKYLAKLGAVVTIVALTLLTMSMLFDNDDDLEMCLLHELTEHRINDFDANRQLLEKHGISHVPPAGEPPTLAQRAALQAGCDNVLGGMK